MLRLSLVFAALAVSAGSTAYGQQSCLEPSRDLLTVEQKLADARRISDEEQRAGARYRHYPPEKIAQLQQQWRAAQQRYDACAKQQMQREAREAEDRQRQAEAMRRNEEEDRQRRAAAQEEQEKFESTLSDRARNELWSALVCYEAKVQKIHKQAIAGIYRTARESGGGVVDLEEISQHQESFKIHQNNERADRNRARAHHATLSACGQEKIKRLTDCVYMDHEGADDNVRECLAEDYGRLRPVVAKFDAE